MKFRSFAYTLSAIALLPVMMVSCKRYLSLEPVSSFGPESVFGSVDNVKKAVFGTYQKIAGDKGYGSRLSLYYPYDTDLMMGAHGNGDNGRKDLNRYNLTSGNGELSGVFQQIYAGVERANQCIKYIPQMELYTSGTPKEQAELKRLYGEALTLRAQFYFDLVKIWGDLPAQWVPSEDQPELFLVKTDRDSIYDHILNDLLTAEDLVPWRSELAAIGDPVDERITKGAVKGLRARIALFCGGYSLRRNNNMERRTDYLDFYKIADTECDEIMHSNGEHTLDPGFEDLWKNQVNAHRIDPYGEIMFQVGLGGSMSSTDGKIGYFNGPGGGILASPPYFYSFDSVDTRRDVTIAPFSIEDNGSIKVANLDKVFDGKFRANWVTNPTIDLTAKVQFMGLNWPLLRYSDVLLMYAEAENEIHSGPTEGAIAAFNSVRARAYAGHEDKIGTPPSDKESFFNAVVNERALEFGGEGIRKYDLIRWNILGEKLEEAKAKRVSMANREAPYENLPATMYYVLEGREIRWLTSFYHPAPSTAPSGASKVNWVTAKIVTGNDWPLFAEGYKKNHSELFPIPQSSIDANPSLHQDYHY